MRALLRSWQEFYKWSVWGLCYPISSWALIAGTYQVFAYVLLQIRSVLSRPGNQQPNESGEAERQTCWGKTWNFRKVLCCILAKGFLKFVLVSLIFFFLSFVKFWTQSRCYFNMSFKINTENVTWSYVWFCMVWGWDCLDILSKQQKWYTFCLTNRNSKIISLRI